MEKKKTDKIINGAAAAAIILFLIGAMTAIWLGVIGVKILLSGIVLFLGDYAVYLWSRIKEKESGEKRERRKQE